MAVNKEIRREYLRNGTAYSLATQVCLSSRILQWKIPLNHHCAQLSVENSQHRYRSHSYYPAIPAERAVVGKYADQLKANPGKGLDGHFRARAAIYGTAASRG